LKQHSSAAVNAEKLCYLPFMMRPTYLVAIGVVFFSCLTTSHAQHMNSADAPCRNVTITVDVANCFSKAAKDADRKLNETYGQVLAVLQADDKEKLRASQRLWVQFRDATCGAERDLYEGGTGANPAYLACIEEETRLRTNDLRTTYGWLVEKFAK
jgi:uncharacterized protein YecT (DUF1311 family)